MVAYAHPFLKRGFRSIAQHAETLGTWAQDKLAEKGPTLILNFSPSFIRIAVNYTIRRNKGMLLLLLLDFQFKE